MARRCNVNSRTCFPTRATDEEVAVADKEGPMADTRPGLQGYEGQPGNQGGH